MVTLCCMCFTTIKNNNLKALPFLSGSTPPQPAGLGFNTSQAVRVREGGRVEVGPQGATVWLDTCHTA